MDRKKQYEQHREYIEQEGLHEIVNFQENIEYEEGVFDAVSGTLDTPIPPEPNDLVRLHKMVRDRKCFTILEFGIGYSTLIFADALQKNQKDWEALQNAPEIRNRFLFQLFSVDASKEWLSGVQDRLPKQLEDRINYTSAKYKLEPITDSSATFTPIYQISSQTLSTWMALTQKTYRVRCME